MNTRVHTITKYSYSIKADAIKRKLARFKGDDFLKLFFKHMHSFVNPDYGVASNYPWCCFLALKWKFTLKENYDAVDMTYNDFIGIINRIYDLQSEAANLKAESNVFLGMRRMMINQFLYQYPDKFNYSSLIRQYLWYCQEGSFYKTEFEKITGLRLEDYYMMASYFLLLSSINVNTESEVFPLKLFIFHWVDLVGAEQVKAFIKLISFDYRGIYSFFKDYKLERTINIEYYQDTPMLDKPVILANEGLVVLSKKILKAGLINIVPETFKKNSPKYKDKFSVTLENYTADLFAYHGLSFMRESEIKKIYRERNLEGKSSDFVINELGGSVMIDCKAIEPTAFVKVSNDPERLKQRLESSFIKGIWQCQQTAINLSESGDLKSQESLSVLIVVHRDHYIATGVDVQQFINPELSNELIKEFGSLPISLSRVYYVTIDELEIMLGICKVKEMNVTQLIDFCVSEDAHSFSKKANMGLHLQKIMPEGVKDTEIIKKTSDILFKKFESSVVDTSKSWSGRVEEYLTIQRFIES